MVKSPQKKNKVDAKKIISVLFWVIAAGAIIFSLVFLFNVPGNTPPYPLDNKQILITDSQGYFYSDGPRLEYSSKPGELAFRFENMLSYPVSITNLEFDTREEMPVYDAHSVDGSIVGNYLGKIGVGRSLEKPIRLAPNEAKAIYLRSATECRNISQARFLARLSIRYNTNEKDGLAYVEEKLVRLACNPVSD